MLGQFQPAALEPPDDVDVILAQERWETTADFEAAAIEWALDDLADIRDRFSASGAYDVAFESWLERETP